MPTALLTIALKLRHVASIEAKLSRLDPAECTPLRRAASADRSEPLALCKHCWKSARGPRALGLRAYVVILPCQVSGKDETQRANLCFEFGNAGGMFASAHVVPAVVQCQFGLPCITFLPFCDV